VLLKHAQDAGQPVTPAAIESAYRKIQQEREIRSTLAAIQQAGSIVEYHSVDVTNAAAFGIFIDGVYARNGKIDGVIHGAGVIEDKLIRDKTTDSFDRVVSPKVLGALTIAQRLRPETLQFLVFFSSVSARYGNRGQGDYAAANEVLNKLARWLNSRWPGRIVSLNWGPWNTDNGMVSSALAAQFAKAGVQMISSDIGPKIFVQELMHGRKADDEIIWGGPIQHERTPEPAHKGKTRFEFRYPLLSAQTELKSNGDGVVLVRETDVHTDIYLADHKLDGKPVMPMAMVLELFAEVAAAMHPNKRVVEINNFKMLRGVTFGNGTPKVFRIQASGGTEIIDLKLETGDGKELHYTGRAEVGTESKPVVDFEELELIKPERLPFSVTEVYDNWLFHGPAFGGIQQVEAIGENGIVAVLKPSNPADLFSYEPKDHWLIDPVVVDSGFQLVIVWLRHYFDETPLPSRLGACRVFEHMGSDPIRCEMTVDHHGGSTLRVDLKFFSDDRLCAWLEDMEFTCSKALNRLSGAYAGRGTTE
jgi:NAD(P)-dependent dehydrogenase (short-subunit alcohol dehydrogenase family)